MAIPATPSGYYVQTANINNYLLWNSVASATSYTVQRSTDGITYSTLQAGVTTSYYLDTAVTAGSQYWYQIASVNLSGTSAYTIPQSVIPTESGEMSLCQLRLYSQQRADRVNSNFVTLTEWNTYINQAMMELYDILVTAYEDYFLGAPIIYTTTGATNLYPLPNGTLSYTGSDGISFVAPPFYKIRGVDLGANVATANNGWVTVNKFNFADRNRYFYPNSASTLFGVFNLQYRVMGNNLMVIPTPTANQPLRIWYIPRIPLLLQETDTTSVSISGWIEYVVVDAAIRALQKEDSDVAVLMAQKESLKMRIQGAAQNRDAGMPETIAGTRGMSGSGWGGPSSSGFQGGY